MGRPEALRRIKRLSDAAWRAADRLFPVRVPRAWFDQINPDDPDDPLALQALPDPRELLTGMDDLGDPVGEQALQPLPWLVQKHPDRVLLLLTRRCHLYCRYCFRRTAPHHAGPEDPDDEALDAAIAYCVASKPREVILSGGDPLAVTDTRLFRVMDALRPAVPVLRVHTRAPITAPERVTEALVAGLRARAPVWVFVHCNHPRELSPEVRAALARLVDAGVPVLNQAVLLRGVNDDVDTLVALCEALVALRVYPYYLHHTDRVAGNAHLRVDPAAGLALHKALSRRVSGLALPSYVVDPPDGSGKIQVERAVAEGKIARDEPGGA